MKTASPSSSTATWGLNGVLAGGGEGLDRAQRAGRRARPGLDPWFVPSKSRQAKTASPSASIATWGSKAFWPAGGEGLHRAEDAGRRARPGLDPLVRAVKASPDEDGVAVGVDCDLGLDASCAGGGERQHRAEDAGGRARSRLDPLVRPVGARPGKDRVAVVVDGDLGVGGGLTGAGEGQRSRPPVARRTTLVGL